MPQNPLELQIYKKRSNEKEHPVRGEYFRDQTAIIHSMPFRRLKHKTQVFFSPENDHVCTRIEHVMHVASIAASICKGLNKKNKNWDLDVELAYAIGIGHDIGHAPFGHSGEHALNQKLPTDKKFMHEINGLRVAEKLARNGTGLNLTYAVKDGILFHNGEQFEKELKPRDTELELHEIKERNKIPCTYEGCIVRFSDKIAYLGRDIEDAIVAGFIEKDSLPDKIEKEVGSSNGEIINSLVIDIIESSFDQDCIRFSDSKYELIEELKTFNYKNIYNHPRITKYKQTGERILKEIFEYLCELYCELGTDYEKYQLSSRVGLDKYFGKYLEKMHVFYTNEAFVPQRIVTDYVAGMTDTFALKCMQDICIPEPIKFNE